ncbi:MAG: imidazole glycerol phosphate synthase subunit HisH [Actinobacteria bacterium]|nr:imidazole glycerol phosphate synthase subunit HisH [Actinomycetota bacterium]
MSGTDVAQAERPLVAVLDYGIGNLRSAEKALQRAGADARLTADHGLIADAAGIVLPGVGAFGRCAEELRASGLADVAAEVAGVALAADGPAPAPAPSPAPAPTPTPTTAPTPAAGAAGGAVPVDAGDPTGTAAQPRPFLGICIGLQLLFATSEEDPVARGLGVLPGAVRRLPPGPKSPQMQWNTLDVRRPSPLLDGLAEPLWVYFVHSFAADTDDQLVAATCDYGGAIASVVGRGRLWATQFHPEKSGATGLSILGAWVASCAAHRPAAARR